MKTFFTKDLLRLILSVVLSLFICMGLFFTAVCADFIVFSNHKVLMSAIKSSNYTDIAVSQITEELNDLAIPSGLPEDFFTGKVYIEDFEKLFYPITENLITGNNNFSVDVDGFKEHISTLVTDYSKNDVGDFSSEVARDIENFSNECANIYLSYLNPSLSNYVFALLVSAKRYVTIAAAMFSLFTLVCIAVVFKMNSLRRFIKYCFVSVCGAALSVGVIPIYLIATNEISKISISSMSLYALVTTLIEQFLWIIIISACVLIFISLILLIIKIFGLIFRR
ncbi:MAG: hypothetical protein J6Q74_02005 [Clostridia bacterium]|nr:hypothetical protein [Clostridia bacterium]